MNKKKNGKKKSKKSPPVYFMDLVVENVRCFKDRQVLDLSDGNGKPARWTIILGDNGTGKTTLLKGVALMATKSQKIPNVKMGKNGEIIEGDGKQKVFFPTGRGIYSSSPFVFSQIGLHTKIEVSKFLLGELSEVKAPYSREGLWIASNSQTDHISTLSYASEDLSQLIIYGYGANRQAGEGSISESFNDNISESLFKNVPLINAEEWLLQTMFAAQNAKNNIKKKLTFKYEKIKSILKKILPDVSDFQIKPITENQTKAIIQAKTPYGWVDMKDLSLGYQTLIAWMVDLAARLFDRYPDSKNPLAEPAIVLVDEIDLHLHPKWQRNLISHLTTIFSQTQFIVTAHSPLIVQSAEDANIVLLKREDDHVKIYNNKDEEVIQGWRIDQVLTSDLFGLESTRPPKYDKYLIRKKEILNKKRITKKDEKELEEIGRKLDEMNIAVGEQHHDALEALQKAAAVLKSNR